MTVVCKDKWRTNQLTKISRKNPEPEEGRGWGCRVKLRQMF